MAFRGVVQLDCKPSPRLARKGVDLKRFCMVALAVLLSTSGMLIITSSGFFTRQQEMAAAARAGQPIPVSFGSEIMANTTNGGYSLNWAGYIVQSSSTNPQPVIYAIYGSWIVQKVNPTSGFYQWTYSAQWIGIGGVLSNMLIQVGTESDANSGFYGLGTQTVYKAWYEMLPYSGQPGNSTEVNVFNVNAGDHMTAWIVYKGNNNWNILIIDNNNGQSFSRNFNYVTDLLTGDFVEERPAVNNQYSILANFGTSDYGPYYAGTGNNLAFYNEVYDSATGYDYLLGSQYMYHYGLNMTNTNGNTLATTNGLLSDQQSFTCTWVSGS